MECFCFTNAGLEQEKWWNVGKMNILCIWIFESTESIETFVYLRECSFKNNVLFILLAHNNHSWSKGFIILKNMKNKYLYSKIWRYLLSLCLVLVGLMLGLGLGELHSLTSLSLTSLMLPIIATSTKAGFFTFSFSGKGCKWNWDNFHIHKLIQ